jgi:ABC-type sugar transport system ATPase subunit
MHLTIAMGELMAVPGLSGSGKTTLLQIICGLVEPTSGRLAAATLKPKVVTALEMVALAEFSLRPRPHERWQLDG